MPWMWIAITLLIACVLAVLAGVLVTKSTDRGEDGVFASVWVWMFLIGLWFWGWIIYIALHFIGKHW